MGKQQKYKIYISASVLILSNDTGDTVNGKSVDNYLVTPYSGKAKSLFQYIDLMEKSPRRQTVLLYTTDLDGLWHDFSHITKKVQAGGGMVFNPKGEMAVMYRRGYWDLPKGKMDKGEQLPETALREVEEELGLQGLRILHKAGMTYHLYKEKGRRWLKETGWYVMECKDQELVPQHSEEIARAQWVEPETFLKDFRPLYRSLEEFIESCLVEGKIPNGIS